ncbi:protein MpNPF33 [Marchantia polymorpha subsp. ruderalis]|uniref:Uncharacterized protein n=1 Tax=Marchantia polymorpha TaxID=3197 RepID=A0A2R6XIM2_MARPO|nr:hypothetical protein MARPO_0013s0160 [Marchantia polymorpha]PTQ45962.1 hypothetical protein MARPO_0013s0160 [Marchantia polymorpha]BBN18882.1 hypothetical protein Mp_8g06300 [Marchantia polymorpha subsp. ruderalis]BBN18883.1 hypothetical protein Mp_8g06300 [Marchantia polymorpha subsp. ruderalis]|eukprot:PTQ45961.1 hypothetical protein MARPO_0013s0160 [Marchantia polymorpha]
MTMAKTEELERDVEVPEHLRLLTHDGTVDYKGQPANKDRTGGWKVTPFICGVEVTEKIATSAAQFNLVSYLIVEKKLPLPYAANMVTNFMGTSFLLSLLGGFLADTFFGRYYTLIGSACTQMIGFVMMLLTTVIPALNNQDAECPDPLNCRAVHGGALSAIYVGLYLIAVGIGGIKATVSSFGADQFDDGDPVEASLLPSYFNWFYWATMLGSLVASTVIIYMQDHVGWDWGYGIPLCIMALALVQLVSKRRGYRYRIPQGSPLLVVARVLVAAVRNFNQPPLTEQEIAKYYDEMRIRGVQRVPFHTNNMRVLDKAAKLASSEKAGPWQRCQINEVEDTKMLLRLLPIWLFTIFYWTVLAQATTFAVAQIGTSNRHLGPNFQVPPGSVAPVTFNFTVICFLPLYDRFMVPLLRRVTGHTKGISTLQRIGVGMAVPVLSLVVAALVEAKRLGVVHDSNAEDRPKAIIDFSMWWFVPQYVILAIGEAFVYPGQLDFFYSEAPDSMQSLGTALMFCTISFGYFSSSAIVSAVNAATRHAAHGGWLTKNINTSRLDLYYWLLCVMAVINFALYLVVAKLHTYKRVSKSVVLPEPPPAPDAASRRLEPSKLLLLPAPPASPARI